MKKEVNRTKKFTSIMLSLTIIVSIIGVSMAFFSTTLTGSAGIGNLETLAVGKVVFEDGNNFANSSNIEPPWSESKTFTITRTKSDVPTTVNIKLVYTNDMPDLEMTLQEDQKEPEELTINSNGQSTTLSIVEKTIPASLDSVVYTYTITATLPYEAGNENQAKHFNGMLYADLGNNQSTIYYNNENPLGTYSIN